MLDWQALPDEYEYDIASSTITVSYPAGATRQGEPEVTSGKADAATGDGQVVFTQGNLSAGDPLVVRLNFAPGSFSDTPPVWQAQTQAQNSRAWLRSRGNVVREMAPDNLSGRGFTPPLMRHAITSSNKLERTERLVAWGTIFLIWRSWMAVNGPLSASYCGSSLIASSRSA